MAFIKVVHCLWPSVYCSSNFNFHHPPTICINGLDFIGVVLKQHIHSSINFIPACFMGLFRLLKTGIACKNYFLLFTISNSRPQEKVFCYTIACLLLHPSMRFVETRRELFHHSCLSPQSLHYLSLRTQEQD